MALPKIYKMWFADDDTGEVEAVFNEAGDLLHWWSCNDASLRTEYLAPLFGALGYDLCSTDDLSAAKQKKLEKILAKAANPY